MKKILIISALMFFAFSVKTSAQLWADNVSVEVKSSTYATCTLWVGAEISLGTIYSYGTFYNVATNTIVNYGTLYFPNIPRPTPPIPTNYVRMVMQATAGTLSSNGEGDWTSPDITWHFYGGLVKIDLDN
jgi:hypothetical protein